VHHEWRAEGGWEGEEAIGPGGAGRKVGGRAAQGGGVAPCEVDYELGEVLAGGRRAVLGERRHDLHARDQL
jgi:hypothetical protein